MYVGSARGPGGIMARLSRHLSKEKRLRWHIDYITSLSCSRPLLALYAESPQDLEERLARELLRSPCLRASYTGFGSSDRASPTHLFSCTCSLESCAAEAAESMRRLGLMPKALYLSSELTVWGEGLDFR